MPAQVSELPAVTRSQIKNQQTSTGQEIHDSVMNLIREALSLYQVHENQLIDLKPDVILTQDHCEVCAVSYDDLSDAVKETLGDNVSIVSVSPSTLEEIFTSFETVSEALGVPEKGEGLIERIKERFDEIRDRTKQLETPRVLAIEWMDPLMSGGNWMPEMIEIVGGKPLLATAGEHSPWIDWKDIAKADPDVILVLPCGYGISKTISEFDSLTDLPGWEELKAVRNEKVFVLDGNRYFNRPGPGILASVEILAEILHPDLFNGMSPEKSWKKFAGDA